MAIFTKFIIVLCAMVVLEGCGTPGAPQPPSLELPQPVRDLQATRKGDIVTLTWSVPQVNVDHTRVKILGTTKICRAIDSSDIAHCQHVVGKIQASTPGKVRLSYTDVLPRSFEDQRPLGFADYAVETQNPRGRSAGLGNHVSVSLAPTLPPPAKLLAEVTAKGVIISCSLPVDEMEALNAPVAGGRIHYALRLFRRDASAPNSQPVTIPTSSAYANPLLPQPNLNVLDTTAEWEHRYSYWSNVQTTVKGAEIKPPVSVEGADSPPVEVFVHDVFPPAAPRGLQAVFSDLEQQRVIDLIWTPNTEPDLAGYNVFRSDNGGQPAKINAELVKTPAYRDTNLQSGHKYAYSVSAVDVRGNESVPSREASESVP